MSIPVRALWFTTLFALLGCTTLEPIAVPPQTALDETVLVGDSVVVRTLDGERYRFEVTGVGAAWIEGGGRRVELSDVRELWIRRDSPAATTVALLGGAALLIIVVRFANLLDDIGD